MRFIEQYGLVQYGSNFRKKYCPDSGDICEICAEMPGECLDCNKGTPVLLADHCHTHGWVRGWVCRGCNVSLGLNWFYYITPELIALDTKYSGYRDTVLTHYRKCPECKTIFYGKTGKFIVYGDKIGGYPDANFSGM